MEDTKPVKRKKESSKDQSGLKDKKKKKLKESKPIDQTNDPPLEETKPKKRKRETPNEDAEKKKKKSKATKSDPEELEIDISAPQPPSKKALRLQKKGKPVPPLPSTSQPPPSTIDTTHPSRKPLVKKEPPRAEFSVWIGNLSYKSDVKALRGWLVRGEKRVTDKDITRIHLPLNAEGKSKG